MRHLTHVYGYYTDFKVIIAALYLGTGATANRGRDYCGGVSLRPGTPRPSKNEPPHWLIQISWLAR